MYTIKIAESDKEFEQIFKLNYDTFVEEIPQHAPNQEHILKDKFHTLNTYIIALYNDELIGMVCMNAERPFSLDHKIPNMDSYLPEHQSLCEVRLLSIKPRYRGNRLFYLLMKALINYCLEQNHDLAVISGTTRQFDLYQKMGFKKFAFLVGKEGAYYQPMYLHVNNLNIKS